MLLNLFVLQVLGSDHTFFTDSLEHCASDIPFGVVGSLNFSAEGVSGQLQVFPGLSGLVHEGQKSFFDADQLVVCTFDVGHFHVVGRRADILELFTGEQIDGDHMDLCVTVLAGLGGRHLHDFAGATLDHNVTALPERGALHGEGLGGAGVSGSEIEIIGHFVGLRFWVTEMRMKK
jgi:hypothetical protein